MSNAIKLTGGPDAQETAKFIEMFDKFFDCLNVDNLNEGNQEKKDFKKPYEKKDDIRLTVRITLFKKSACIFLWDSGCVMSS